MSIIVMLVSLVFYGILLGAFSHVWMKRTTVRKRFESMDETELLRISIQAQKLKIIFRVAIFIVLGVVFVLTTFIPAHSLPHDFGIYGFVILITIIFGTRIFAVVQRVAEKEIEARRLNSHKTKR